MRWVEYCLNLWGEKFLLRLTPFRLFAIWHDSLHRHVCADFLGDTF